MWLLIFPLLLPRLNVRFGAVDVVGTGIFIPPAAYLGTRILPTSDAGARGILAPRTRSLKVKPRADMMLARPKGILHVVDAVL